MRVRETLLKFFGLCVLAGVLLALVLAPVAGAFGSVALQSSQAMGDTSAQVLHREAPLVTTVTDRSGAPIAFLYDQNRTPVEFRDISPSMKAAILAIEDRRFYEHTGVDWPGTIRALVSNQSAGEVTQGASTITQQYVKNYRVHVLAGKSEAQQAKAIEQTPARKIKEIRLAKQLEQSMSKEEILTNYLNLVPFGNKAHGIATASRLFFQTTPDKLNIPQSALLAGIVNSPSALNPETNPQQAIERRNTVIDAMFAQRKITREAADMAKAAPLGLAPEIKAPPNGCVGAGPSDGFFCRYVSEYLESVGFQEEDLKQGGYTIRTSLDHGITAAAKAAAEKNVPKDAKGIANVMSVVEPGKDAHKVRALVANRDFGLELDKGQTSYALPSGVSMFGAGSVFKVFTAAAALEQGMGINTSIPAPAHYTAKAYPGYSVGNAEGVAPGPRTIQKALATSPNTAFVALQERVGLDKTVDMAVRLGLRESLTEVDGSGLPVDINGTEGPNQAQAIKDRNAGAFTLGFGPVSPLELSNVGATLVSGGTWCPPSPIEEIRDRHGNRVPIKEKPCEQVVDEKLANGLAEGMSQDDKAGGTANQAASGAGWSRPMAGKTGTTEAHQSAGFLGATPQFAGAVLLFSDSDKPQGICDSTPPSLCGVNGGNIYGGKAPARTWFDAMSPIHENLPVEPLPSTTGRYENGGESGEIVPDVVGKDSREAVKALHDAGYRVVERQISSQRTHGVVAHQTPRGSIPQGEFVTLYVSTGAVPPPNAPPPPPVPVVQARGHS